MPAPILPWVVGALTLGLIAMMKGGSEANAAQPVSDDFDDDFDDARDIPVTTMPVGGGQTIVIRPTPTSPPEVVHPIVEEDDFDDQFDSVSPGLPIQPPKVKPPKLGTTPIKIIPPEAEPVEEVEEVIDDAIDTAEDILEEVVEVVEEETGVELPRFDTQPIKDVIRQFPELPGFSTQPVEDVIDIDVPDDLIELPDVPDEVSQAESQIALTVYNMALEGPGGRAGKLSGVKDMKAFQTQQGIKADGIYGTATALELIEYGFVPPRPWSFTQVPKSDYNHEMREMAKADPQRAEEWLAAQV